MEKDLILENDPISNLDDFDLADLENVDLSDSEEAKYEVWALGRNKLGEVTDTEVLLKAFNKPEDATAFACSVNLDLIKKEYGKQIPAKISQFDVEVETVVYNEEEDYFENVGTIFRIEVLV